MRCGECHDTKAWECHPHTIGEARFAKELFFELGLKRHYVPSHHLVPRDVPAAFGKVSPREPSDRPTTGWRQHWRRQPTPMNPSADTISKDFAFVRMLLRFCPSRPPHFPSSSHIALNFAASNHPRDA